MLLPGAVSCWEEILLTCYPFKSHWVKGFTVIIPLRCIIHYTSGISMMKGRFWNSGDSSLASVTNTLTVSTTWKPEQKCKTKKAAQFWINFYLSSSLKDKQSTECVSTWFDGADVSHITQRHIFTCLCFPICAIYNLHCNIISDLCRKLMTVR